MPSCKFGFDNTGVGGWCVTHHRWHCPGGEALKPKTKKSNEERQADEIERASRLFCRSCGQAVDEHRVYFGVVGPFCNVVCRDVWAGMP